MCEYLFNSFTGKRENKSVGPFKVRGLNMGKTEKDLLWFMQLRKTKTVKVQSDHCQEKAADSDSARHHQIRGIKCKHLQ